MLFRSQSVSECLIGLFGHLGRAKAHSAALMAFVLRRQPCSTRALRASQAAEMETPLRAGERRGHNDLRTGQSFCSMSLCKMNTPAIKIDSKPTIARKPTTIHIAVCMISNSQPGVDVCLGCIHNLAPRCLFRGLADAALASAAAVTP